MLAHLDELLSQHVAVLGKTRSGKSSVLRLLVEHLLARGEPVCIVDPKGDWWGIKLAADGKGPGFPVVIFGGEHADVPINEHAGAHVAEIFATGNRPCLIDLGGWMVGERTRFWIDFASSLFRLTRGKRWLVIDEVHNFGPKGKIMDPSSGMALHWTNRLASEGLGKGVAMLFASQRPQKVHNDTLTSAETLIAMRVLHKADRDAITEWIKGCGDPALGKQVLDSLAQMPRGEGWVWSPEIGVGPERARFPLFRTYDSFRPQSADDARNLKGWAEVDLDEVLAAVAKEAEENDPKRLKARIAELEKASGTGPDRAALDRAREEGWAAGVAEGRRQQQAADAEEINGLQHGWDLEKMHNAAMADRLLRIAELVGPEAETYRTVRDTAPPISDEEAASVLKMMDAIDLKRDTVKVQLLNDPPGERPAAPEFDRLQPAPIDPVVFQGARELRGIIKDRPPRMRAIAGRPDGRPIPELPKGERAVLTAIAQHGGGVTREQLTVLTGYKRSSRDTYLQRLRERGLIMVVGNRIEATAEGVKALGPSFTPLPTGAALRRHWLERLPEGERRVLEAIIAAWPRSVAREAIGKATGYKRSSRDTYIQRLGARQLIESVERGAVQASNRLFEAAKR